MASVTFWVPLVAVAVGAGLCGYVVDRLRSRKQAVLLRNGPTQTRSEVTLRYHREVWDSSNG